MKVGPMGTLPEPASARSPVSSDGLLTQLHWRRALEQAQWELHGRLRPESEKPGNANREIPSSPGRTSGAGLPAESHFDGAEASAVPVPTSGEDVPAPRSDVAPARPLDAGRAGPLRMNVLSTTDATLAATIKDRGTLQIAVEECLQSCTRFADTKWSPVSVQVWIDGRKLTVTLRDASLSAREEAEIHQRLQERLASMGLELHELIINGHPVSPAAFAG